MAQREELTRFMKAARARLSPADVGLPAGERRRTRGLRREEVATLAGMSVTWYTWFEQGRDVQLSVPMIERLGRALRLEPKEREFLFALAQHRPPPLSSQLDEEVRPGTQALIDALNIPALVIVEDWTVVGWNRLVQRVFRDYAPLPRAERNLFRILMLGQQYRVDPERYREMARRLTARFKWDYSRTASPEVFDVLIAEMRESSEVFAQCWEAAEIRTHFEDVNTAALPEVGQISFHHTSYAIEEVPGQRLILFAPADAESAEKLRRVAEELRAEVAG
ncbi:helix-turn-helix domain-containing protein [Novosphingobium sp. FSY-8]|uniref:Helix-turn-helix domain-containing protein n=2 Tax=Novosphingobium ovatum TaxID=1908523 RepID=A0ABW9X8V6_9SPHN|nr:helix-turn-helix domain-containing protein [Novosphingobium ovatum]